MSTEVKHYIETRGLSVTTKESLLAPNKYQANRIHTHNTSKNKGNLQRALGPSLLHLVHKKDGNIRHCGDYRHLNYRTLHQIFN